MPAVPLSIHDLRVVQGEACFLDRRLSDRLGYDRPRHFRRLIERNRSELEKRFGTLRLREDVGVNRPQGGGTYESQFWLTKAQALFIITRSDATYALDVVEEIITVFLAVAGGEPIPASPFTEALFAPDTPTIVPGDDNVVHLWKQDDLFNDPTRCNSEAVEVPPFGRFVMRRSTDRCRPVSIEFEPSTKIEQAHSDLIKDVTALLSQLMKEGRSLESIRQKLLREADGDTASSPIALIVDRLCGAPK